MPKDMSDEEARRYVQERIAKIGQLMAECESVMDRHGFSVHLGELKYIPLGLEFDDEGYNEGADLWLRDGQYRWAQGQWLSSSSYKDC